MTTMEKPVKRLSVRLEATLEIDRAGGRLEEIRATAPFGHRWKCGVHEFVTVRWAEALKDHAAGRLQLYCIDCQEAIDGEGQLDNNGDGPLCGGCSEIRKLIDLDGDG